MTKTTKLDEMTARELREVCERAGITELRVWSTGKVFFARAEGRLERTVGASASDTMLGAIERALLDAGATLTCAHCGTPHRGPGALCEACDREWLRAAAESDALACGGGSGQG